MQSRTGNGNRQGVLVAPDPSRSRYAIEVPWLIANGQDQSQALDSIDVGSLRALLSHRWEAGFERGRAPVETGCSIVEVREDFVFAQGVHSEQIVSDIVESIGKYTGITDLNQSVSRLVYRYLENRCYGRQVALNEAFVAIDLIRSNSTDYIARYLSQELIQGLFRPTFIRVDLASTLPFIWTTDVPLLEAKKTVFQSVATVNEFEREFAIFLERCEDVVCFASLAVVDQYSLAMRGKCESLFSSFLPCDPDWVVVDRHGDRLYYSIVSTKIRPSHELVKYEFMAAEWCRIASRKTGDSWRRIRVDPDTELSTVPSFYALVVDDVCRALTASREAQKVSISLDEILQMRDEGRP